MTGNLPAGSCVYVFLSNLLQVLDNLPHDLIYSKDQVSPWMEVWVENRRDNK